MPSPPVQHSTQHSKLCSFAAATSFSSKAPPSDNENESRGYDPKGVGHNLKDSLGIFGLARGAIWMDIKAEFKQFSRLHHPDKHNPARTNMANEEAKTSFQLFSNARDFLEEHYRRTGHM